jgi:hypothetical protein
MDERRCACPAFDARTCVEMRSRPSWDRAGEWTEGDERCEWACHYDDYDDGPIDFHEPPPDPSENS